MLDPLHVPRTVAVVVAHDRRDLLVEALTALAASTAALAAVVVVDNASTDGSAQAARGVGAQRDLAVDVVELERNTGGAGGFAAGIARALTAHAPDLVWLMDDDTIPTPTALAELLAVRARYARLAGTPPVVLASRVVWHDGREHPMNTPRARPGAGARERELAARAGGTPIRSTSFVSLLADAGAVRAAGLPVADYFLWNDDFEYSTRLLRSGVGLHCPASVVVHKTKVFGSTDADPGPRFRFEVRNKVWMFTRSTSLAPWEKVLYGGSSLRRWARTLARSSDRGLLLSSARTGVAEALRRPRPTAEVLAGLGEVSADVAAVEAAAATGAGRQLAQVAQPAGAPLAAPAGAPAGALRADAEGSSGPLEFSLLLPVYAGDRPQFLRRAFTSAVVDQTRRPAQVVVVRDGPVPPALAACLAELVAASPVPVTVVELAVNQGLALALEAGLAACTHDVVARMDADDVSEPHRFAVQLPVLEAGADLVGSALTEFEDDEDAPSSVVRVPPLTADAIARRARLASPFNHPTVVYRASVVARAGGYRELPLLEDYWLFTRMISAGARTANVAEPLVRYRVGAGSYARRGGWRLLRAELLLQRHLHAEGFTTLPQHLRNVVVRGGYRAVPVTVRRLAYRATFTRRRARPTAGRREDPDILNRT